jgi:hypothetical protein
MWSCVAEGAVVEHIDRYLKHSRECRIAAQKAGNVDIRRQYAEAAAMWEQMAKERLRLLQLQMDVLGPPGLPSNDR